MAKHITVAAWAAKHRNELAEAHEHEMRAHLTHCPKCAALDEALGRIGKAHHHSGVRHAQKKENCLDAETAANYFNRQYSFYRRWQITRHLSACNDCRKLLAELMRMEATILAEEDQALLQTLPPFQIEEWAARLASSSSPDRTQNRPRQSALQPIWPRVKNFLAARPVPAYGLAFAVTLLLALKLVWPEVKDWRSAHLAQQGMQALAQVNDIAENDLRPTGGFQPELLSGRRGAEDPVAQNFAEQSFQNSLDWNTNNLSAKRGQALAAYFAGHKEQAHRALQELHLQNPADAEVMNDLGVVSAALDAPGNALYYFDHALRLKPRFPETHFNRAALLQKLNRREEARRAWQAYLELHEGTDWQKIANLKKAQLD